MGINTSGKNQFRVSVFNAGQNSADEPNTLGVGSAALIENGIITKIGKVEQRKGLTRIGDSDSTLQLDLNFNGSDLLDATANDNDGTGTDVTFVSGKFGKGVEFNGTSSVITIAADSTIDATSMVEFRLSAWIYVDTDGGSNTGRIFDKFSGTDIGYRFFVHSETASTVKLSFEVGLDDTNALVITSTTLSTGVWHKVDAMLNSDLSADIYIDGTVASYSTDTSGVGSINDDSAVDLLIGNNAAGDCEFDGKMDDVRIYDGATTAAKLKLDKVQGITRYKVGTTINRVYRIINTTLQRLDDDFTKWTDIDTGFSEDKHTNFVQAKDILFILNGTDNVHTMASDEAITDEGDTNTDPPKTTLGCYTANNRLFLSGSLTAADRNKIWFSDTLDPQTFDRAANFFEVKRGSQGKITQICEFRENIIVIYKEDGVFLLDATGSTPLTDWSLKTIIPDIGCPAGRTVVNLGNEQVFLARDGVRVLSLTEFDKYRAGVISDAIDDIIQRINWLHASKSCAYYFENKYILAVPVDSATEPNIVLVWDSQAAKLAGNQKQGWSTFSLSSWTPTCFTEMEFTNKKTMLVMADSREISMCYKAFDGNTDNGNTINLKLRGPTHSIDYVKSGIWYPAFVTADSNEITSLLVYGRVDGKSFEYLGSMDIDNATGIDLPVDLPFSFSMGIGKPSKFFNTKKLGRGKSCQLEFLHNTYNKGITINEYSLWVVPKN